MGKTKGRFLFALMGFAILLVQASFGTTPARAQAGFEVSDVRVTTRFGQEIVFEARLKSPVPITSASILFHEEREAITRVESLELGSDGSTHFVYDATQKVLPPFSTIIFWYQATLENGSIQTSGYFNVVYTDDRFTWRDVSSGPITLHWYDGDDNFAQAALDAAGKSLLQINEITPLTLGTPINVYVYSTVEDLQGALTLGGQQWVAGHANPELGMVMVAIPPGGLQSIEMETEIPHELAHVMLYRALGKGYNNLPAWLSEGLASMVEGYPNADYAQALSIASKNGSLLPFKDLCDSFPPDTARAFLAYAQSQSFVRYLRDAYGTTGLTALTQTYANGLDCETGTTRALSASLNQLDARWRETALGQNVTGVALRNLSPYLLVMVLVLLVPLWGAIGMMRERRQRERRTG
jgi:hypothetical protein